jgi:serine/threonine protein kinase
MKGYDDSRGDLYLTRHDHIGYRYEILSLLGKGSFGQVVKCYDHKLKMNVAVKVIRNKKRFEKQGLVEVHVLNRLTSEDKESKFNLVHCLDHFYFRGHLCFSFELLGINLYEWLKAGNFKGVHLGVVKTFSRQILQCLSLLDKLKIIHCDLKPEVF